MIIMIIAVINRFLIILSVTTDISHSLPITDVGASTDRSEDHSKDRSYRHGIATRVILGSLRGSLLPIWDCHPEWFKDRSVDRSYHMGLPPVWFKDRSVDRSYQYGIATRSDLRIAPWIAPTNMGLPPVWFKDRSVDRYDQYGIATRSDSRIAPWIAPTNIGLPPGVIP